jgi:hypothetical protein
LYPRCPSATYGRAFPFTLLFSFPDRLRRHDPRYFGAATFLRRNNVSTRFNTHAIDVPAVDEWKEFNKIFLPKLWKTCCINFDHSYNY